MSTPQITDAERAALPVAQGAVQSRASMYGPADAVVFALGREQLLRTPAEAAEMERLLQERAQLRARLAELEPYEALTPQTCPRDQHLPWFTDSEEAHACPWCRIAQLEDAAGRTFRAARGDIVLGTYMTPEAAAAACEADLYAHQTHLAPLQWLPAMDRDDVLELVGSYRAHTSATGYTVTTVTVAPAYDPEAEG